MCKASKVRAVLSGRGACSLTYRERRRLRAFDHRVPRGKCVSKGDEGAGVNCVISSLTKYCENVETEENGMGVICSMHWREVKRTQSFGDRSNAHRVLVRNPKGKNRLNNVGDGMILLKCI
jgi:hypothetical protein